MIIWLMFAGLTAEPESLPDVEDLDPPSEQAEAPAADEYPSPPSDEVGDGQTGEYPSPPDDEVGDGEPAEGYPSPPDDEVGDGEPAEGYPSPEAVPPPREAASKEPPPVPTEEAIARQSDADPDAKVKKKWKRTGSPQRFELEVKFGPYLPDVDEGFSGPGLGPYATIFGKTNDNGVATGQPRIGFMPAIAFEWQIVYLLGPLGLATQVGIFWDRANAILAEPEGDQIRSSADTVSFWMVPLALQASYRFSYLADRFKVPLVPYAKFGPSYAFWWTQGGDGKISTNDAGNKGRGGVWGWQLNAGLMLRMDFIERGLAKQLDESTGINHTYIFGEFQMSRLDNFGVGDSIQLGDITGFGGLAIEF